jgi:DNA-directed RNA polymerase beta' subunit
VQRRVIGTNLDVTGLGVITPNPSLKLDEVGLPENLAWDLYEPFIIRNMVQHGYPATEASKAVSNRDKKAYAAMQDVIKERPILINRAPTLHKYSIMAAMPVLTKGNTLQIPPAIVKPLGADFDGDTMSFSVPVSKDAVDQALQKMLPSKNLLSARNDKPNYAPSNEYLQGLYLASKAPSKKPVRIFKTTAEAEAAWRKGEIDIDDPIRIVDE